MARVVPERIVRRGVQDHNMTGRDLDIEVDQIMVMVHA
jgi:hypothetical protein